MKEITITDYRTNCSAILSRVQRTKKPIRITRHRKPVAEIIPVDPLRNKDWMGSMKGRMKILGDIISPACDESDWEVLRPPPHRRSLKQQTARSFEAASRPVDCWD
jgi:prevent-host-death family protein